MGGKIEMRSVHEKQFEWIKKTDTTQVNTFGHVKPISNLISLSGKLKIRITLFFLCSINVIIT